MASTGGPPQSTSSDASVNARAKELRLCATRRWLVKDELVFLLLRHKQQTAVPCLRVLQPRPMSGTLLFYDTNEVSDFKKDGWRWQQRKDNSGRVREDRAKLVINREVIILGTYVHSAEIPTFHRRNYYLRDSNQHVMLVHYFDEVNKTDPAMDMLVPSKAQPLPRVIPVLCGQGNQSPKKGLKRTLPPPTAIGQSQLPPSPVGVKADLYSGAAHSVDAIMKDCFAMDYHVTSSQPQPQPDVEGPPAGVQFSQFEVDETLFSDLSGLLSPASALSHDVAQSSVTVPPALVEISDFSPGWDFVQGGAKILFCLAAPLPPIDTIEPKCLFVQFGTSSRSPAERLSDTVLRCAAPSANSAGQVEIFVCYSSSPVSSDYIQVSSAGLFQYRSVLTSSTPMPALANESLMIQVEPLSHNQDSAVASSGKRGRSPGVGQVRRNSSGGMAPDGRRWSNPDCSNLSAFVDTDLDERQCKIRVVERLAEFQDAIRTTSTNVLTELPSVDSSGSQGRVASHTAPRQGTSSDAETNAALDDGAIEALSDQDLESLSEQLIENVVRQLVTVAHTSEELLEELNSLDETGLSLLHYVSFYNYSHLIPLLLSHGAQVNQQSTQGQTPLHLAAGCGHAEVVSKLLEAGAELFALDFDGMTPAERAEKSSHIEISQHLRKFMTDSCIRENPFEAELSPVRMWDDTMEGMDIDDHDRRSSLHSSQERPVLTPEYTSVESELDYATELLGSATYSTRSASYVGENQEHNRKLLLGAFSTMSLHDKCALSLSISRDLASSYASAKRRGSSTSDDGVAALMNQGSSSASSPGKGMDFVSGSSAASLVGGENEGIRDSDVKSVIADDEENLNKLGAAMELMGPEEIQSLEEEARVIQSNVRAWLLRRNCRNMRETTKRLHEAAKNIQDQQKQNDDMLKQKMEHEFMSDHEISERERAAVTVQAAARSMLARKSFLQTRNVTIKVQAATRGVLCRKNFARMKTHALASLVIQRNVREWLSKQPSGSSDVLSSESAGELSCSTGRDVQITSSEILDSKGENHARGEEDEALMRELNAALDTPAMSSFLSS